MNELTISQNALTAQEVRAQVNLIQQVLDGVMKENVHYGRVPGCGDKPTLLKAGAEKIMATFRLASDPQVEDLSTSDEIRYRITVRMLTPRGNFVGSGVGECSSGEEKYKWRRSVCDEEWEETPEDRRREKWIKPYNKDPFRLKQIRTNPSDIANTVLKMAKKRALVDAVLTATAASDIFDQDLEDMPEGMVNNANGTAQGKPNVSQPQPKSNGDNKFKQMLEQFKKAKQLLGEDDYYHILKKSGYKHANEIKKISDGNKVLGVMKAVIESTGDLNEN